MRLCALLSSFVWWLLQGGCASGLRVTMLEAAHRKPSNVAVFFSVHTSGGEPVPNLEPSHFHIYEDDSLVSLYESRQTIVNPEVAVEHYTLLLIDMSASVSESGQVPTLVEAASRFTDAVGRYQKVAVYAFDGSERAHAIQPFSTSGNASARGVAAMSRFAARDPSTNLHGAVVQGVKLLDEALARGRTPLKFGTLVVFTDGKDRADRVSLSEMRKVLDDSDHQVLAIGVGNEIDEKTLSRIGHSGFALVKDSSATVQAFAAVSERIVGYTRSHYLLSYCTPARAGKHRVTIQAVTPEPVKKGRLDHEFEAAGFGPGCDPNTPPPFEMKARVARPARTTTERKAGAQIKVDVSASAKVKAGANPEEGDVR